MIVEQRRVEATGAIAELQRQEGIAVGSGFGRDLAEQ